MKRLPILLLALMAALFIVTLHRPEAWAGWLHAFSEAGMVGAIADWFAVVALFRHPLGIPVPHTAIIPRRKNEIGENLARFVAEHFLQPDAVRLKLANADLAGKTAEWLHSPDGPRLVHWLLGTLHREPVRQFIVQLGSRQLAQLSLAPLLGRALDRLVQDRRHQEFMTQSLRFALVTLHDNRELIRGNVQRGSPWWMPGFIDDRIVVQLLDRIETLLLELSLDPDHALRGEFDLWLVKWAQELQHSSDYRQWGDRLREGLLVNVQLQHCVGAMWDDFVRGVETDIENPQSEIRTGLSRLLSGLSGELERNPDLKARLNAWLVDSAVSIVEVNRHSMASLISDTVRNWDATETSERIEQAIGRDLQFIRVNGTLVGGLVGLAIHAVQVL